MHSAAKWTSRKCNSIGQLIDLRQINIDERGDQSFCVWAFEHQLRQRNLQQSPMKKVRPKCPILLVPGERIELPTTGLQNRCSTAELTRLLSENTYVARYL
jgi:hypothetical protein